MSNISYWRQLDWFDPAEHQRSVTIIGCGGIGSFTAQALAKLGIKTFHLWDPDKVESHNVPNQWFDADNDIGDSKVNAIGRKIESGPDIHLHEKHWTRDLTPETDIVISAVDSIEARRDIAKSIWLHPSVELFVDGRIGGQVAKVFAIKPQDLEQLEWYEKTLNGKVVELPCTGQSIIDVAYFVAAMITRVVRRAVTEPEFMDHPVHDVLDVRNLDVVKFNANQSV